MTRHCWKCGWVWTLSEQPGRNDSCHQCGTDLKACLNCVHYDRGVAYQCRERRADPVLEKNMANFCEFFEMAQRTFTAQNESPREAAARENLRKLLGD